MGSQYGFSEADVRSDGAVSETELPFYCVSLVKLAVLSVVTLGLYELVWFYKNWKLIRDRSGDLVSPFWRAAFSMLFCYSLADRVSGEAAKNELTTRVDALPIAVLYAVLLSTQRLPDPYSLLSLMSFVPLLVVASQIRDLHERLRPGAGYSTGWNGASITASVLGGVLTIFVIGGALGPPTRAIVGPEVPSSYQTTLRDAGILLPEEQIEFFYSAGFFSIMEDGNLLTETRAISYEEFGETLHVYAAAYEEITTVSVDYSESFWEDTIVTISTSEDEEFLLLVSAEDGRDREFVSALQRRVAANSPQ